MTASRMDIERWFHRNIQIQFAEIGDWTEYHYWEHKE